MGTPKNSDSDFPVLEGIDAESWQRWVAYRKAIRKPIKSEASARAMQLKLMRLSVDPAEQAKIVDQSIENTWQGLFSLRDEPVRRQKPSRELDRDEQRYQRLVLQAERAWQQRLQEPLQKLRLASALLARYDAQDDQSSVTLAESREWLRDRVAAQLRVTDAQVVLDDPELRGLVMQLFGPAGVARLEQRARGQ